MFTDLLNWGSLRWFDLICFITASFVLLLICIFMLPKTRSGWIDKIITRKHASLLAAIYLFLMLGGYIFIVVGTFVENFNSVGLQTGFDKWGQVGDYFGGMLNPILAFASFIALLYTIRLQSEELRLTKDELVHAADARELTEANMREQIKLAKQQNEMQFYHQLFSGIEGRLHDLINAQIQTGKVPLDPYKKTIRGCFAAIKADQNAARGIDTYNRAEEQDYRLKEVRYEVVLLFSRFTISLHDYHNKFGQTAVSFNYVIQYVELAAALHALTIINAKEGHFQIFNIDEFYQSSGINF